MAEIKAIETIYNGYRFRSRLEARWAVFFDALNIEYQYEPEGFKGNGYAYLPDFYLPKAKVYIEVKPSFEKLMEDEKKLSNVIAYNPVFDKSPLIILGQIPFYERPSLGNAKIPSFYCIVNNGIYAGTGDAYILPRSQDTAIMVHRNSPAHVSATLDFFDSKHMGNLYKLTSKVTLGYQDLYWELSRDSLYDCSIRLLKAFTKARQARFEHGEKG